MSLPAYELPEVNSGATPTAAPDEIDIEMPECITKACEINEFDTEIAQIIRNMSVEIADASCHLRVVAMVETMKLQAGCAMDITTMDVTSGWDFAIAEDRQAAKEYMRLGKPKLLIGSPMYTTFHLKQNLIKERRRKHWKEKFSEAKEHIKFVVGLY